jgi:hypothetical protein
MHMRLFAWEAIRGAECGLYGLGYTCTWILLAGLLAAAVSTVSAEPVFPGR